MGGASERTTAGKHRARRAATFVLVVLSCVLTLFSALAIWMRTLVLDTDAYVRAVGPVLDRADVREALATNIVGELYRRVDVAALLRESLPRQAATFAPTLAASIRTTSVQLASAALGTKAVRSAWRQANRVAHDQIVWVLEGKGSVVSTRNGEVAIETRGLVEQVRRALDSAGIHVFDTVHLDNSQDRFVLFRSQDLLRAQQAVRVLDDAGTWLPVATVAVMGAVIAVSTHRRRTVQALATGVAAVMLFIVVGVAVGRSFYLNAVGSAIARPVAAAPFDALVVPLRTGVRVVFGVAVLVCAATLIARARVVIEQEERLRIAVADVLRRYARPLAFGGAAVVGVVLVAWDRPRPLVIFAAAIALVVWEVAIALSLRRARSMTG